MLRHTASIAGRLWTLFTAGTAWFAMSQPAWAQDISGTSTKSYVGSYALVAFLVGFGLLVVCKSSGRREEVKKEDPVAEA